MDKPLIAFSVVGVLAVYGCVLPAHHDYSRPMAPPATTPEISAIGIAITERKMNTVLHPDVVYFAKIEEMEDMFTKDTLLASNYSYQGHSYLLNITPGRYVAVAFGRSQKHRPRNELIFFPKNMIQQTETVIGPGELHSMGTYEITHPVFGGLFHIRNDNAQRHYFQVLLPDTSMGFWSAFGRFWLPSSQRELSNFDWKTDRSVQAERNFLDLAESELPGYKESESWSPKIRSRLTSLENIQ